MAHIGDFGKAAGPLQYTAEEVEELDTVGIAGQTIRLKHPHDSSMFAMSEFARLLALGISAKDMTAQSTLYGVWEASVYPDDYGRFRNAAITADDDAMVKMTMALYERWATVPLAVIPESSDGSTSEPQRQSESSRRSSRRSKQRAKKETPEEIQARLEAQLGLNQSGQASAS